MINKINFGSTYQIPLTERGINPAKKERIKDYAETFENKRISNSNSGSVKVSIPLELDKKFEETIKRMGFSVFKKIDKHNVPSEKIESVIAEAVRNNDFQQFGKNKQSVKKSK